MGACPDVPCTPRLCKCLLYLGNLQQVEAGEAATTTRVPGQVKQVPVSPYRPPEQAGAAGTSNGNNYTVAVTGQTGMDNRPGPVRKKSGRSSSSAFPGRLAHLCWSSLEWLDFARLRPREGLAARRVNGRRSPTHFPLLSGPAKRCVPGLQLSAFGFVAGADWSCRLLTRERALLGFWNTAYYVGDAL